MVKYIYLVTYLQVQQKQHETNVTDYDHTPSAYIISTTRTDDEVELPEVTDNNRSVVEKKRSCEMTLSRVKTRKQKRKSAFLLNITLISGSEYRIIDSSMLLELISAPRCSFCKNGTLQVRQDNKKKGMCETLLLYCKSCGKYCGKPCGKMLKTVITTQVVQLFIYLMQCLSSMRVPRENIIYSKH